MMTIKLISNQITNDMKIAKVFEMLPQYKTDVTINRIFDEKHLKILVEIPIKYMVSVYEIIEEHMFPMILSLNILLG